LLHIPIGRFDENGPDSGDHIADHEGVARKIAETNMPRGVTGCVKHLETDTLFDIDNFTVAQMTMNRKRYALSGFFMRPNRNTQPLGKVLDPTDMVVVMMGQDDGFDSGPICNSAVQIIVQARAVLGIWRRWLYDDQ
jgi:hypothetical protein